MGIRLRDRERKALRSNAKQDGAHQLAFSHVEAHEGLSNSDAYIYAWRKGCDADIQIGTMDGAGLQENLIAR